MTETWMRAIEHFESQHPGVSVRFAFLNAWSQPAFHSPRLDILYTYPQAQHSGLLHWRDECAWHEEDLFVVAIECSKWIRLAMKKHPFAESLLHAQDIWGKHAWDPPIVWDEAVETWLQNANAWLCRLRDCPL